MKTKNLLQIIGRLCLITLATTLYGCRDQRPELSHIYEHTLWRSIQEMEKLPQGKSIPLDSITPFAWEKVYVFYGVDGIDNKVLENANQLMDEPVYSGLYQDTDIRGSYFFAKEMNLGLVFQSVNGTYYDMDANPMFPTDLPLIHYIENARDNNEYILTPTDATLTINYCNESDSLKKCIFLTKQPSAPEKRS